MGAVARPAPPIVPYASGQCGGAARRPHVRERAGAVLRPLPPLLRRGECGLSPSPGKWRLHRTVRTVRSVRTVRLVIPAIG